MYIFISVSREKINECLEKMLKLMAVFFFWLRQDLHDLSSWKGIEPQATSVKAPSPKHYWKFPKATFFVCVCVCVCVKYYFVIYFASLGACWLLRLGSCSAHA